MEARVGRRAARDRRARSCVKEAGRADPGAGRPDRHRAPVSRPAAATSIRASRSSPIVRGERRRRRSSSTGCCGRWRGRRCCGCSERLGSAERRRSARPSDCGAAARGRWPSPARRPASGSWPSPRAPSAAIPAAAFVAGLAIGNALFITAHFGLGYVVGEPVVRAVGGALGPLADRGASAWRSSGAIGWFLIRRRRLAGERRVGRSRPSRRGRTRAARLPDAGRVEARGRLATVTAATAVEPRQAAGAARRAARPFVARIGPRAIAAPAVEVGHPAAGLLDEERSGRRHPRLEADLDHRLGGALGDQRVAPEVAEPALAPDVAEQRLEAGRPARRRDVAGASRTAAGHRRDARHARRRGSGAAPPPRLRRPRPAAAVRPPALAERRRGHHADLQLAVALDARGASRTAARRA